MLGFRCVYVFLLLSYAGVKWLTVFSVLSAVNLAFTAQTSNATNERQYVSFSEYLLGHECCILSDNVDVSHLMATEEWIVGSLNHVLTGNELGIAD